MVNAPAADGEMLYESVCVYSLALGKLRTDEPKQAEEYANRAVELLKRAQAAGYFKDPDAAAEMDKDEELQALRHKLQAEIAHLQEEKASFAATRLRLNGEVELSRRQLHDEQVRWAERKATEEAALREQTAALERRQARLGAEQARTASEVQAARTRCERYR